MSISGSRVLIVGGTSGIGLAVATAVVERGATPIVASRRPASVDTALAALPEKAEGATVDLTDEASVMALVQQHAPLDHVVYTAGEPLELVPLRDLTPDIVRSFFETRFLGAIAVVRAVAPLLRAGASITLTSGTAGDRPGAGWALGASVCGAMSALTRALAVELAPVRVNAVAPGVVRSPLWAGMSEQDRAAMYDDVAAATPLGRVAEVEDVALAYVYAMQQVHGTGIVITVDGGTVLA
ncbi:MAG TPA: SDR family oxidoreductase [Mycobacteriales bacterium]|jgi:NAD(P)-dependent dehydrogenase (short-subunit alcohol dehydrogenase family)